MGDPSAFVVGWQANWARLMVMEWRAGHPSFGSTESCLQKLQCMLCLLSGYCGHVCRANILAKPFGLWWGPPHGLEHLAGATQSAICSPALLGLSVE